MSHNYKNNCGIHTILPALSQSVCVYYRHSTDRTQKYSHGSNFIKLQFDKLLSSSQFMSDFYFIQICTISKLYHCKPVPVQTLATLSPQFK